MRNQRNNLIPVPTKPARGVPKPLPRVLVQRKTSSSQTERVVLIKEENMTFYPCTRLGQNDGGMRRDYAKAVNYINSCHRFINALIEKNYPDKDKSNMFLLPMVANFIPLFPHLLKKPPTKNVKRGVAKKSTVSEDRKSKSSFGVKKEEELPPDPTPVGDCEEVKQIQEDKYANQVADIVKEQIHNFLNNLHDDMNKAVKNKPKSDSPKKCKNLDIIKQRLEELSKICCLQKNIESSVHITPPPVPPSPKETIEDRSVILSDAEDCEENKKKARENLKIASCATSDTSLCSDSSDIKSDSDLELLY